MSQNKRAVIRYNVIDKCLQRSDKKFYIEDLLAECNKILYEYYGASAVVQKRQLYKDLDFMKDSAGFAAPIEAVSDGNRRKFYRYSDSSYSIHNRLITHEDAEKLRSAMDVLSRLDGLLEMEWMEELAQRLEQEFGIGNNTPIIDFDTNQYYAGHGLLSSVAKYIRCRQPLEISYRPFGKMTETHILHPYYLKQYNRRWFLFGLNDGYGCLSNFPLDRIQKIEPASIPYKENVEINFTEYFEDCIGVSRPVSGNPEKVVLRIGRSLLPYIETKPLHGSQKILQKTGEWSDVQIEVFVNYELKSVIKSYGIDVEVIAPEWLRRELGIELEVLAKKYLKNVH